MKKLLERLEGFIVQDSLTEAIADTILQQLGGRRKLSMFIGAKNFASDNGGKTLVFTFSNKKRSGPNHVKITLNSMDTYDIQFSRIGQKAQVMEPDVKAKYKSLGMKPPKDAYSKKIKSFKGIYDDQLIDIFEKTTGLYLRL